LGWIAGFSAVALAACADPAAAGPGATGGGWATPILVYHRFDRAVAGPTTITLAALEDQLAWLAAHHYRIVTLRTALAELEGGVARPPAPAVAITDDDGHESVYTILFPLIRKAEIPVTLFIYPSAISNAPYALTWAQLQEMQASGLVDVESHTYWHPNFKSERRRRSHADYEAFVDDQLGRSKAVIEKQLGRRADLLAWPYGIFDPDLEAAAKRAGYSAAFAYGGGPAAPGDDLLALPRVAVSDADRGDRFGAILTIRGRRRQAR
jgi:peptidoglycan/xylan/chitin deacetylase (PgdA/CDA1 family)